MRICAWIACAICEIFSLFQIKSFKIVFLLLLFYVLYLIYNLSEKRCGAHAHGFVLGWFSFLHVCAVGLFFVLIRL